MKYGITLYAVPELSKVSGGPRTRISKISEILSSDITSHIVTGNYSSKIKLTFKAPSGNILYIESSTNRLKIIDIICLLILKIKSRKTVTYIRDVYIQLFPENYKSIRGSFTKYANKISNWLYTILSDKLAFPTIEMGQCFFKNRKNKKKYFELPPGSFDFSLSGEVQLKIKKNKLNFLYLGGTQYKYSGFNDFLKVAFALKNEHNFYVFSGDNIIQKIIDYKLENSIKVYSLSHKEVLSHIKKLDIDFVIHSRPENLYDDITYPIKVMDCISSNTPIISVRHKPLFSLLTPNYPFFVDEISTIEIKNIISKHSDNKELYSNAVSILSDVKEKSKYSKQVLKIVNNVE